MSSRDRFNFLTPIVERTGLASPEFSRWINDAQGVNDSSDGAFEERLNSAEAQIEINRETNVRQDADLAEHEGDKNNPHDTSWSNLLGKPAEYPPAAHTHVEADITDLNRLRWRHTFQGGETYLKNDLAHQGQYTGVANKTTTDGPEPAFIGDPTYIYQGTIGSETVSARQVIFGLRIAAASGGHKIEGWRVNVVSGNSYTVYVVADPLTAAQITQLETIDATSDGWIERLLDGKIVEEGRAFDLMVVVTEPSAVTTNYTLNYDYVLPNNATNPLVDDITHAGKELDVLRVNKTTNDGDPTGQPPDGGGSPGFAWSLLGVGDVIEGAGKRWSIQSVDDMGTWMAFGVAPALQGTAGTQDFVFEIVVPQPITVPVDPDTAYWDTAGLADAAGLYFVDAPYDPTIPNHRAYGINLLMQAVQFSPNWDLFPY